MDLVIIIVIAGLLIGYCFYKYITHPDIQMKRVMNEIERKYGISEEETIEKKIIERENIERENNNLKKQYGEFSKFYQQCLNKKLLTKDSKENKEEILKLAESLNFPNENINDIINKMYNMEYIKNAIFNNYYFIKLIEKIFSYSSYFINEHHSILFNFVEDCYQKLLMSNYQMSENTETFLYWAFYLDSCNAYFDYILPTYYIYNSPKGFDTSQENRVGKYYERVWNLRNKTNKTPEEEMEWLCMMSEDKKKYSDELMFKTAIEGLLYYANIMNIIQNNKELSKIYNNLLNSYYDNTYIDYDYISQKIYDIYSNFYIKQYTIDIEKEDFKRIFILDTQKIGGKDYSEFYCLISERYASITNVPKKVYNTLFFSQKTIDLDEVCVRYIRDKKDEMTLCEIFDVLLSNATKISEYYKMIEEEKEKLKEKNKEDELEKERKRLIEGNLFKEKNINIEIERKKKEQNEIELNYNNIKNGYDFEKYVAKLYQKLGYEIEEVTRKSGDQGADVIVNKNGKKYVIQAKFYNSPVSNKAVQEVVAAIGMYKADKGIVVTNNRFTDSAIELAKANNIELVNGNKIEEYKETIIANI